MPTRLTLTLLILLAAGIAAALSASAWPGRAQPRQAHSRPQVPAWPSSPKVPAEIRVAAPGYQPWGIRPRGGGTDKVMSRPVRLVRE